MGVVVVPPPPAPSVAGTAGRGAGRLWLYGMAMVVPAVGFAWRYPLRGNDDRLLDIGKLSRYGAVAFAGYVGGLGLMFVFYALALRESRRVPTRVAMPAVFGCGAALALVMAWLYPVNAIDLFIYAVRSRIWTSHGANPQVAEPREFPDDALMRFASREWADEVSPYGPLWNPIAAPITALAGDRMFLALVGFKALAVVSVLAGGWLIARALVAAERGGPALAAPATGSLFYLWNPLVLWEGIGNGHNDVVMVVPLLLAILAWVRGRDRLVVPALVAAALIKYVAVLLIPLAVIALWRRTEGRAERGRLVAWSGGLSLLVAVVAFFPFYDPAAAIASVADQGDIFLTSPAAMAIGILRDRYPVDDLRRWLRVVGYSLLALTLARQALVLWRRPTDLPRAAFETLFVLLLVATWNFRAWYLIWPVALGALLPWGWAAWRTIAWTIGGLAGYALFIWGWHWWGADFVTVQNVAVPMMTGPALVLTLAEAIRRLQSGRPTGGGDSSRPTACPIPATGRTEEIGGSRPLADYTDFAVMLARPSPTAVDRRHAGPE